MESLLYQCYTGEIGSIDQPDDWSSFRCVDSGFFCCRHTHTRARTHARTHAHTHTHTHTRRVCRYHRVSRPDSPPPPPCPLRWIWGWICLRGFAPRRSAAWSDTSPSPRTPRTPPRPSSRTPSAGKHRDRKQSPGERRQNRVRQPETLVLLRPPAQAQMSGEGGGLSRSPSLLSGLTDGGHSPSQVRPTRRAARNSGTWSPSCCYGDDLTDEFIQGTIYKIREEKRRHQRHLIWPERLWDWNHMKLSLLFKLQKSL